MFASLAEFVPPLSKPWRRPWTGKDPRCQLIPQFRILIVSAVEICKQCLQTASVSVDFVREAPYRGFASRLRGLQPQMKISRAATDLDGDPIEYHNR